MAVTETRPVVDDAVAPGEADVAPVRLQPTGLAGLLGSGDHKVIGKLYIAASLLFLLVAAGAGLALGTERIDTSGLGVLGRDTYLQAFTLHSVAAVFLFLLPMVIGLATIIVPLQVGAATVAFPRAASAAFWTYLVSGGVVVAAYAINGGPFGGDADGVDLFLVAFAAVLLALLLGTVCVVTTVLGVRTKGMTLDRVPMFAWSMVVAGTIWVLTLPVLVANLVLLYVDHHDGRVLFGGNFGIYPRIMWAFGQPQIYVFAVPALGIVADIVPVFARTAQRSRPIVMGLIAAVGVLGIGAYAQPAIAPGVTSQALWVAMAIAVVLPIFGFAALIGDTVRRGTLRFASPFLFAFAAVLMLLAGAVAGAIGSIPRFDLRVEQGVRTTWDAGQAHYVLVAVLIALLGAMHHWAPVLWGRTLKDGLGQVTAGLLLVGTVALAIPDLYSGAIDQPAGLAATQVRGGVEALNAISAFGGLLVTLGVVVLLVNLISSLGRRGGDAVRDPWDGHTLEWAFADGEQPAVTSATPVLDARPSAPDAKE